MDLSLQELQKWYIEHLCNRDWVFTCKNGRQIVILFTKEDFCHLTGIRHIYNNRKYEGAAGWDKIESGKVTLESMKKFNAAAYNRYKERILYFTELESLLRYGAIISYSPYRCKKFTRIQADIVIYTDDGKKLLHLFAREKAKSGSFAAVSFVIKNADASDAYRYIENQIGIHLKSREVIIK